jgi:hypothetical protein
MRITELSGVGGCYQRIADLRHRIYYDTMLDALALVDMMKKTRLNNGAKACGMWSNQVFVGRN